MNRPRKNLTTYARTLRHSLHCLIVLSVTIAGNAISEPITCIDDTAIPELRPCLKFAFSDRPPWAYRVNGEFKGLNYEIISAVTQEMGYRLEPQQLPPRRRYEYITSGHTDMTSIISSPELKASIKEIYSDKLIIGKLPLYHSSMATFALKESNIKASSVDELADYRVGHVHYHKNLESALLKATKNITAFSAPGSLVKGLLKGRVDVVIDSPVSLFYNARQLNSGNRIEVIYNLSELQIFPAWSKAALKERPSNVINKFNDALKRLKERGDIADIIHRYAPLEYVTHYGNPPSEE